MTALITVRLTLRILHADDDDGFVDLTRSIPVAEIPRVGDTVYLNPLETAPRKVIAREWGFDGSPAVRLATINAKNEFTPNEGAKAVKALQKDGWEVVSTISE